MIIKVFEISILLVLSLISDIKSHKIKNNLTLTFALIGAATNVLTDGVRGLGASVAGWFVPVMLLFVLFALGMLGAGDIKLFGAIGAIMGAGFAVYSTVYSFLAGGIMAIVILLVKKMGVKRMRYFINYLKGCFLSFRLLPYSDAKADDGNERFPFACAAVPGTLIQLAVTLMGLKGVALWS